MEEIKMYVAENPSVYGWAFIVIGAIFLLSAIFNPLGMYKKDGKTYNVQKRKGMVNMFGPTITRIIFGTGSILLIGLGILCL